MKLLIKFISADLGQIISAGIKEHRIDQAVSAFNGKRLAGTDLFVEFQKTGLIVMRGVLGQRSHELGLFAEEVNDLFVGADAQGTDQNGDRHLSGTVYSYIKDIVGVCLILQPCAPVGDHGAGEELFAEFILVNSIIDTGRTDQLADDDSFRAIDHKGAGRGHQRKVAHEDFLFLDFPLRFLVIKAYAHPQRCRIVRVVLLALFDGILDLISAESVAYKGQAEMAAVIVDGRNVVKDLLEAFVQEPLIGILLDFQQVGHLKDLFLLLKTHPYTLTVIGRMHPVFFHLVHPVFLRRMLVF